MKNRPLWYWLCICLILGWIGVQGYLNTLDARQAPEAKENARLSENAYMGIQKVGPDKMRELFSDANNKPLLIMFHSRYCFDCKRMKPVIEGLLPKHAKLAFKSYDVLEDKQKYSRIFSAFKPVSVPILVFVKADGSTSQILYNYQKTALVESEIRAIGG